MLAALCVVATLMACLSNGDAHAESRPHHAAEPRTIVLAYEDTALPPYYLGETNAVPADKPGISIEILRMLDAEMEDVAFVFKRMPWKRCLYELQNGVVDAAFPGSFKEERTRMGVYPTLANGRTDTAKSMVDLSYYLYVLEGSPVTYDGEDIHTLEGGVVAAPLGYSINDDLRAMGVTVDESGDTLANLLKLVRGRAAAIAVQDVTADALIMDDPRFTDVRRLEPPLRSKPNYLLFSHQFMEEHPELAQRIWSRLAELVKEKTPALAQRYHDVSE